MTVIGAGVVLIVIGVILLGYVRAHSKRVERETIETFGRANAQLRTTARWLGALYVEPANARRPVYGAIEGRAHGCVYRVGVVARGEDLALQLRVLHYGCQSETDLHGQGLDPRHLEPLRVREAIDDACTRMAAGVA